MPLPDNRSRPEAGNPRAAEETKIRGRGVGSSSISIADSADNASAAANPLDCRYGTKLGFVIEVHRDPERRAARRLPLLSPGALAQKRNEDARRRYEDAMTQLTLRGEA